MIVASNVVDLRREITAARRAGKRIGFVPTMGNLHAGHLKLIEIARARTDYVVASIYVNPMQFGPQEDFAAYPRTPEDDQRALNGVATDLLFIPTSEQMYPRGMAAQTVVDVPGVSDVLCGSFRPEHFRGVATVVNHFFNMVQPDVAVFGKKDYQQLLIIRLMVADLGMPIEIIGVDTVRELDGLAMSSRNKYLKPDERAAAAGLYVTLCKLRDDVLSNKQTLQQAQATGAQRLLKLGFQPDYVSVVRQSDLAPATEQDKALVVLAAGWLGRTRLIDNVELNIA